MRAGSRRGVLGSVGHGAGRDHVCSQVSTERYSLRMWIGADVGIPAGIWHPRNPASGSRRRTAGGSASYARRDHAARRRPVVRRGPSARMTRIVIHGQTTRSSLFRGRFVTRYVHDDGTWRVARAIRYYILLFRCVGRSLRSWLHALLIDIVRREIRSVHVHGRAVDSNDDVTTARENETRSTRAGESREASLRADPGRSL